MEYCIHKMESPIVAYPVVAAARSRITEQMIPATLSRVLIIYTGGTLGMQHTSEGYLPFHGDGLTSSLANNPRFHDPRGYGEAFGLGEKEKVGPRPWPSTNALNCVVEYPDGVEASSTKSSNTPTPLPTSVVNGTPVLKSSLPALITPPSLYGKRTLYSVFQYENLLDSSNMNMSDWIRIATDIEVNYALFDAFIVIHGTDTMSYTASALSFMLEDLGKTVILTGSQVPLAEVRNDAVENLLGALTIAGHFVIPEVGLFFANKLYRGNRSSKSDAVDFEAFETANCDALVHVGTNIKVDWSLIHRPRALHRFKASKRMDPNVAALRIFPGITASTVEAFLRPPIRGVVLETYGAGNAPSNRPEIMEMLGKASSRGVVIVNTSQCRKGTVSSAYATGRALLKQGVVSGSDMTTECALAKLSYLLAKPYLSSDDCRALIQKNLRGELTLDTDEDGVRFHYMLHGSTPSGLPENAGLAVRLLWMLQNGPLEGNWTDSFAPDHQEDLRRFLQTDSVTTQNYATYLLPLLLANAAGTGALQDIQYILETACVQFGLPTQQLINAQVGALGRTALHLACSGSHPLVVEYLLRVGASVHVRDREGHTPLWDALFPRTSGPLVQYNPTDLPEKDGSAKERLECVSLIQRTGGHLGGWMSAAIRDNEDGFAKVRSGEGREVTWRLFNAAQSNDLATLELLYSCHVDFNRPLFPSDRRTLLHLVASQPLPDVLRWLLELIHKEKNGHERRSSVASTHVLAPINFNLPDMYGQTPLDNALFALAQCTRGLSTPSTSLSILSSVASGGNNPLLQGPTAEVKQSGRRVMLQQVVDMLEQAGARKADQEHI
jgi:lysophospholipase